MSYYAIEKLKTAGYVVEQCSPYHFKVYGWGTYVNIWPSSDKYMKAFGDGASIYTDVIKAVEEIIGTPEAIKAGKKHVRPPYDPYEDYTPQMLEACKWLEEHRDPIFERIHASLAKK